MYTESYLGDVDGILQIDERKLHLNRFHKSGQTVFDVAMNPREKPLSNGLTRTQRADMVRILNDVIFGFAGTWPTENITFKLDGRQRIIIHNHDQAVKLYHRLTGESIFGGKLTSKKIKL